MSSTSGHSLQGTPNRGLCGAALGFFVGFAAVALFGPTASRFQEVMQLSPVLVGLLIAAPALSGSLLRIPFSAWVDTTGGRKPFLVLLTLSVIGMAGLLLVVWKLYPDGLTPAIYPLLLLLGVLSGCGIATFSVGISQVSYWFPQRRQGSALGAYAGIGNLAPGLFSFLLPLALVGWGLTGAYLAWLIFLIAGTLLYARLGQNAWYFQLRSRGVEPGMAREAAKRQGQELFPAGSMLTTLARSARVWKTWTLVVVYFTTFGGFIALTGWLPTFWKESFAMSGVTAGGLTALYAVLTSVIRVYGGTLADQLGGETTALLSLGTMFIGAVVMTLGQTLGLCIAGTILLAIGMGVCNAAVFKLVPQEIPDAVGGASGWVGGLGAFGGFAIPPLMGAFVSSFGQVGYARGFIVFVLLAIVSLAMVLLLRQARAVEGAAPATAAPAPGVVSPLAGGFQHVDH